MKKLLLTTVLLLGALLQLNAQGMASFNQGNQAYNEGNYQEAISFYESVLAAGEHSFELYYNLGNAYYKLNDIANSIYFFEKAKMINPEDNDLLVNLAFANQMTIDAIAEKENTGISKFFDQLVKQLDLNSWATLAIVFSILFVGSYILFLLSNKTIIKRLAFAVSVTAVLISLSAYGLGLSHQSKEKKDQPAIVFSEVVLKAEPNERAQALFSLHPGTKLQLVDHLGEWSEVQIADGQTGWVPNTRIKALK